ncbi:MAG: hypothetical protein EOO10_07410 [Chitinophagaceae bacterium]|nr:MAG: hypothetical protein EOO10_07410 [Chitinophagaceae bacterium]
MNVCFNGEFFPAHQPLVNVQNASYKWGDGVFETMRVFNGKLLLQTYHFERLFASLQLLQIDASNSFTKEKLLDDIQQLCTINQCGESARVRLAVYRNDDTTAGYSIEATPLDNKINAWDEQGLIIGLHPYVRKTTDAFANIKSASFLPYVLAKKYAEERKLDDVLVLNVHNKLCDSSRANLFLIKEDTVFTPALHQGCVNGVMRRKTIEIIKQLRFRFYEEEVSEDLLLQADEVFLTNAIQTIRWVQHYKDRQYNSSLTRKIFDKLSATIY